MRKFKIAIIGAGWLGIGCLRVLSQKGYELDVFEKNNDLGGVWHPDNNYAGLRIHAPACSVTFPDYPLPSQIDRLERITSTQLFNYLKEYCTHFDIYKHMYFNMNVTSVQYDSITKKSKLLITDKNDNVVVRDGYDYVIYTYGLTDRTVPYFKGRESYLGKIYHSFDVNEKLLQEMILANKNITVLGGSKTATDFILKFNEHGYKVNWICRAPYWFIRFEKMRKWLKQNNHYFSIKWLWIISVFSLRYMPKTILWFWIKCNIIHTFGKQHLDHRKFHGGIVDDAQMRMLKRYYQLNGVSGDVESLETNAILLKDGKKIPTDVLICCTGSGATGSLIDVRADDKKINLENITSVYRDRVIPEVPNLLFIAFFPFSFHIIKGISEGNWIATYLELQPDTEYLIRNATQYDYNFFTINPFFDSKRSAIIQQVVMYDVFLKANEVTQLQVLKYAGALFFNPDSMQALEFKLPDTEKKAVQHSLMKKISSLFKRDKG